jgi:hypothetical protein
VAGASLWHDRGVPATPHSGDDFGDWSAPAGPPPEHGSRRGRRRRAEPDDDIDTYGPELGRENRENGSVDVVVEDEDEPRPDQPPRPADAVPVRRMLSLGVAGFALLVMVGLVVGAQTTHGSYAVVIFFVQALFVGVWTMASRPPAPRIVAGVGLVVAIGTDLAAVLARPASLAPLAYVTAGGFIVGVIGQLTRPKGRSRVTESLGSTLLVTLGVVSFAMLIVLGRKTAGTQALVACLCAAGIAIVVARAVDVVAAFPRIAPQVPRGGVGVVLGAMAGTAAAGVIGQFLDGVPNLQAAVAGLSTAIVAVMVDLCVGYAEASRMIDGDEPALWLARHIQGPLGAFAFASPAAYVASTLLLIQ